MSKRLKKASRKRRGSRTCGWGRVGQHRKKGKRCGKGEMTGADGSLWTMVVKYYPNYFGKHGFHRHKYITKNLRTINLDQLNELSKKLLKSNLNGLDLNGLQLGFDKVLGKGKLDRALNITAREFSKIAIKKIEAAGGKIVKI